MAESKFIKVGGVCFATSEVTHVNVTPSSVTVHFTSGANTTFTGTDAGLLATYFDDQSDDLADKPVKVEVKK